MELLIAKYIAILLSSLALGVSVLTFYWTHIREKNDFYLVRIDRMLGFMVPEFALINGGSNEILITSIECCFNNKNNDGGEYPEQHIKYTGNESLLLQPKKAVHCSITFPKPFTSEFALEGELWADAKPNIYRRDLQINITWVDSKGENRRSSAVISKYGFTENGEMRSSQQLEKKHNLYKNSLSKT